MSAVIPIQIENPKDSWQRLESSPEWAGLTTSQRVWVTQFLATGSALLATKAGYKASSYLNARILSYELAKNSSIVAAIDVATGRVRSEREILIAEVKRQLKSAEKGSVAASRLAAQLERLILGGQPEIDDEPANDVQPDVNAKPSTQTFPIGAVLVQDNRKYRVVAEEISE